MSTEAGWNPRMRELMFSCPHCGDPAASTVQPDVDIHAGATYQCNRCGEEVIFEVLTVAEYCRRPCADSSD